MMNIENILKSRPISYDSVEGKVQIRPCKYEIKILSEETLNFMSCEAFTLVKGESTQSTSQYL